MQGTEQRPHDVAEPRRSVLGPLVATTIMLVAVVGAAVGGSWEIEPRFDLPQLQAPDVTLPIIDPGLFEPGEAPPRRSLGDLRWPGVVARILLVAAAVALAWWLLMKLRSLLPARRPPEGPIPSVEAGEDLPDVPALVDAVTAAQRLLTEVTDPTNAVIAAWLALEDAASEAGVTRRPSQTPSEFTVAVLAGTDADPHHTGGLLALYHRARFSRHPIEQADVDTAAHHLTGILDGLLADLAAEGETR